MSARAGGAGSRWLTNFVVNCSQRSAEVHEQLGYSAVPHAMIPNGYDPDVFHPDDETRAAIRASLGVDEDVFLVGSITRWHADKDLPTLLRAMSVVRDRGIPAMCVLVGRGLSVSNLDLLREVEKAGLNDKTLLLGLREDVADVLRALDLHVLSSRSEAFPNVVAESMLSGVPNVATDVGDSAYMVGDTGWVVEAGDADGIAAAIEQAHRERHDSPQYWQKRRSDARQRVVERYTLDRMMNAYEELWRRLGSEG
jgi:glycosyltransferase involved in cell wall biosynthesis